jgi:hypothetical protein
MVMSPSIEKHILDSLVTSPLKPKLQAIHGTPTIGQSGIFSNNGRFKATDFHVAWNHNLCMRIVSQHFNHKPARKSQPKRKLPRCKTKDNLQYCIRTLGSGPPSTLTPNSEWKKAIEVVHASCYLS